MTVREHQESALQAQSLATTNQIYHTLDTVNKSHGTNIRNTEKAV